MPTTWPGPVVWVLPMVRWVKPVVDPYATGSVAVIVGSAATVARTSAGSDPGVASTWRATATVAMARRVIVALDAARNTPRLARSATATATAIEVTASRPGRRRINPT